mmetsp:Transcript_804/g.1923  ORF Transcript_804/g.1923 Transcript_804/m.1923 type:complete len:201 (+) Transcript_804:61-663(+)
MTKTHNSPMDIWELIQEKITAPLIGCCTPNKFPSSVPKPEKENMTEDFKQKTGGSQREFATEDLKRNVPPARGRPTMQVPHEAEGTHERFQSSFCSKSPSTAPRKKSYIEHPPIILPKPLPGWTSEEQEAVAKAYDATADFETGDEECYWNRMRQVARAAPGKSAAECAACVRHILSGGIHFFSAKDIIPRKHGSPHRGH